MAGKKIVCVDPGVKRIGIAISDSSQKVAVPLTILPASGNVNEDARRLRAFFREYDLDLIVVGKAINKEGKATKSTDLSINLARALKKLTNTDVVLYDERFSTKVVVKSNPLSRNNKHTDDLAATKVLQDFLDQRFNNSNEIGPSDIV